VLRPHFASPPATPAALMARRSLRAQATVGYHQPLRWRRITRPSAAPADAGAPSRNGDAPSLLPPLNDPIVARQEQPFR
jgi:hypothetical protein